MYNMKFHLITLMVTLVLNVAKCSPVSSDISPLDHEGHFGPQFSHDAADADTDADRDSVADNFVAINNGSHVAVDEPLNNSSTLNETASGVQILSDKEVPSNASQSDSINGTINEQRDRFVDLEDSLDSKSSATDVGSLDKLDESFGFKPIVPLDLDAKDETGLNATESIAVAGLNENVDSDSVAINESTNDPNPSLDHRSPAVTINELEENGQPSVLDLHPVLSGNRTIKFRAGEPSEWQQYTDNLASFLEPYTKDAQERNVHCDFERVLSSDQACRFDLVYLGPSCTKENNFGYAIGKPCVIISPAKIANWVPTAFDNESIGVPDEVQRLMRIFNSNFLFVTCEGETELDRVNIGPMAYLPPYQGFPSYFFPYKGDTVPNYVAPLMAVEFLNPTNGTLINVACRAWARNLPELPRQATLKFSLQVN